MSPNTRMSNNDRAIAQIIYARDCIYQGRLLRAKQALNAAISLIGKQNHDAIDDEVIRLISGDE